MQSVITMSIYFAAIGACIGLWILMLVDLSRRDMTTGARLAWVLLLLFVPVLGLIVYYLTIVKPGTGVPREFMRQAGNLLTTSRGKLVTVLGVAGLSILLALLVTPTSMEIPASDPARIREYEPAN